MAVRLTLFTLGGIPTADYPQTEKKLWRTKKTGAGEAVSLEVTFAYAIQADTLAQLLIEKGLISEQEFFTKLKQFQLQYEDQGVKS